MIQAAKTDWEAVIPDAGPHDSETMAEVREDGRQGDLIRLDQLLESPKVSDVLKLRLGDMRRALLRGNLADADRRLLRILHRKAIIDGAIVEA
jgi:hypothetical protein